MIQECKKLLETGQGIINITHAVDVNRVFKVDYHDHDFYEILYFISGSVSHIMEGGSYLLRPGDLIIIPPNKLHQVVVDNAAVPYDRYVLWFSGNLVQLLSSTESGLEECLLRFHSGNRLVPVPEVKREVLRAMLDRLLENPWVEKIGGKCLFGELMAAISRLYFEDSGGLKQAYCIQNQLICAVLQFISEKLTGRISLDDLSARFFMSKFHLCREFKKHMGLTIHQYVIQKRLMKAKRQIAAGESLTQVYADCGFGDYSSFWRQFTAEFGMTPRDYQDWSKSQM